jgi:CubicO group peptidase (beta-lactamase class C family)
LFLSGLLARHGKLRFEPGAQAHYSNLGPLVLAAALAAASGQPFTELVGEQSQPWTPRSTSEPYGPVSRTVVDSSGLAQPPENRKVSKVQQRRLRGRWRHPVGFTGLITSRVERVTGIGGVFLRSADPDRLSLRRGS